MRGQFFERFRSPLRKIFWITVAWTVIALIQFSMSLSTLLQLDVDLTGRDIWVPIRASSMIGVLAGLFGGSGIVFLWEKWLRTKPYGWTLLHIFFSYIVIYSVVSVPAAIHYEAGSRGLSSFDPAVWEIAVFQNVFAPASLPPFIYWLLVVVGTLIVLQVNDKYGPGVFRAFLMGKYFQPRREERVFMFLDLRSSTTIAEQLGETVYFHFLRDVIRMATRGILKHRGEVYQYVGDEIVVSWPLDQGLQSANCLQCFFEIKQDLQEQASYFKAKYGVQPVFKAGLHYGHVMAGEIGVVKRDIAFSGDVLNTTARIQSKCNELGVDVLLSKYLADRLPEANNPYHTKEMGEVELRGKESKIALFTV